MNTEDFTWVSHISTDLNVYINGEFSDRKVDGDGALTLKFDDPGTYYVLANGNSSYAAAPVKIVVEEGASFADSTPASALKAPASLAEENSGDEPDKKLLPALIIAAIALIVISAVITAIRSIKHHEK
jgi:hypothetical protein